MKTNNNQSSSIYYVNCGCGLVLVNVIVMIVFMVSFWVWMDYPVQEHYYRVSCMISGINTVQMDTGFVLYVPLYDMFVYPFNLEGNQFNQSQSELITSIEVLDKEIKHPVRIIAEMKGRELHKVGSTETCFYDPHTHDLKFEAEWKSILRTSQILEYTVKSTLLILVVSTPCGILLFFISIREDPDQQFKLWIKKLSRTKHNKI